MSKNILPSKIYTTSEVENLFFKRNYRYFSICITPWHLAGISAYINYCEKQFNSQCKALIVVLPHPQTGYCLGESEISEKIKIPVDVVYSIHNYNLFRLKTIIRTLQKVKKYRSSPIEDVYLLSTPIPFIYDEMKWFLDTGERHKLILIDEGVSGYLSPYGWMRHSYSEEHNSFNAFKVFIRQITSKLLLKIMNTDIQYWMLYDSDANVNDNVAKYYQCQFLNNKEKIYIQDDYILYVSQPAINKQEEIETAKVIDLLLSLCIKNHIMLMIKPHPRDSTNKWSGRQGYKLFPESGAIEEIYPRVINKPKCVIGTRSTALLTLNSFYKANCISLLPLVLENEKRKSTYDEAFYIKHFANQITMISSTEDLKGIFTKM